MQSYISIIPIILIASSFVPYIFDIVKGKTKPHIYTWLVWFITGVISVVIGLQSGGGYGLYGLMFNVFLVGAIVLLSIKYGTKDIVYKDKIYLSLAFLGVILYFLFQNPVYSLVTAIFVDLIAYIPTFRKTYNDPDSESLGAWVITIIAYAVSIIILENKNFNTMSYITSILTMNIFLSLFIIYLRRVKMIKA
jgi:hypothetical protein